MAQETDPNLVQIPTARKHGPCWWCGKPASQERTFQAYLTPLSRTTEGRRHTKETLTAQLQNEEAAWRKAKIVHPKCTVPAVEQLLTIIDQVDQDNADAQRLKDLEFALLEHRDEPAVQQLLEQLDLKIQDNTAVPS